MLGKKLVSNLQSYLNPLFDIPVYTFDRNQTKEIPCIVVGYDVEEMTFTGAGGHYTVSGFTQINFQGYEDPENSSADSITDELIDYLISSDLNLSLNKPLSGTDTRPVSAFGIHKLAVRSVKRQEEDHSTTVHIDFDAFCVAKDLS